MYSGTAPHLELPPMNHDVDLLWIPHTLIPQFVGLVAIGRPEICVSANNASYGGYSRLRLSTSEADAA